MKSVKLLLVLALTIGLFSGCMGRMGLSKAATGINLKLVDNRYGRAGIYIIAAPVYAITASIDLILLNSIEFWTGKNPMTGDTPLADVYAESWIKINKNLDSHFTKAPITDARIYHRGENTVVLEMKDAQGTEYTLIGVKDTDVVNFYLDDKLVTTLAMEDIIKHTTQVKM